MPDDRLQSPRESESMPTLNQRQVDVLSYVQRAAYQQAYFSGADLRSAQALVRRGLLEPVGYDSHTFGLTDLGRTVTIGENA